MARYVRRANGRIVVRQFLSRRLSRIESMLGQLISLAHRPKKNGARRGAQRGVQRRKGLFAWARKLAIPVQEHVRPLSCDAPLASSSDRGLYSQQHRGGKPVG